MMSRSKSSAYLVYDDVFLFILRVDTIDGIAMFSKFDISMIHKKKKHIHFTTIDNALDFI